MARKFEYETNNTNWAVLRILGSKLRIRFIVLDDDSQGVHAKCHLSNCSETEHLKTFGTCIPEFLNILRLPDKSCNISMIEPRR